MKLAFTVGMKFGKWEVVADSFVDVGRRHQRFVPCRCACGHLADVWAPHLRTRHSLGCRSCQVSEKNTTHGMRGAPEYGSWKKMRERCHDPKCPSFATYGAAGIEVCERWRESFGAFLADMGPRPTPKHSIDRIDNQVGYEPANCRWATPTQQSQNRRSIVKNVDHDGRTQCIADWARETGIKAATMAYRLRKGWPVNIALAR